MSKSRTKRWAVCVACVKEMSLHAILVAIVERKRPHGRRNVDDRIILRWIFKKQDLRMWPAFI
jgi:hypothetical protein